MKHALSRIVTWGHEFLAEVVSSGDLVVDLTAGNGQDTLKLFELVGVTGQVIAFDIQTEALTNTRTLLEANGAKVRSALVDDLPLCLQPGIDLVQASHADFGRYVVVSPRAIIANLGYLPGGDQQIKTHSESTTAALEQSCPQLAVGGRIAVVVYPGHPGGEQEATAVTEFFSRLSEHVFEVIQLKVSNRLSAPFLFVAEKLV